MHVIRTVLPFNYLTSPCLWQCEKTENIDEDLKQLSYGIVTVRSYGRYDVNGFRFRSTKFEATRPLAATTNSGVVASAIDAQNKESNYYGIIKDILEFDFAGNKILKLVFFDCDWFHPTRGIKENQFGMIEVKHSERLRGYDTFILAHQVDQVYYMSYPCPSLEAWWVVYKVNPREQLHVPSDADYLENQLEVGVNQIYQDDEGPSIFNVETEMLPDSLVGDRDDVVVLEKRKREPRKKKLTWRPLTRRKRLDPDFEYD